MIDAELAVDLDRTFAAALEYDDPARARTELLAAGWLDSLDEDEPVATAIVFRIQGATCRDAAALDDVITRRVADRWPEAAGDLAVAYPLTARAGEELPMTHAVLPGHRQARRVLWMDDLGGEGLEIVELEGELTLPALGGVDPDLGLLGLSAPPSGRSSHPQDAASLWNAALAAGRVAVAHQMVAGARAMLSMAVDYAQVRKQFGTPIGTFQAVKHRLAETLVVISAADAAVVAAATTGNVTAAATAKVLAGRAAATAARNCLQVFGGVGFTTAHTFHRYLRRNLVLDRLLGDGRTLEIELGTQLRTGALTGDRLVNLEDPLRIALLA